MKVVEVAVVVVVVIVQIVAVVVGTKVSDKKNESKEPSRMQNGEVRKVIGSLSRRCDTWRRYS